MHKSRNLRGILHQSMNLEDTYRKNTVLIETPAFTIDVSKQNEVTFGKQKPGMGGKSKFES